ncbi:DUF4893 domain-containing protein [Sphingomonas sp. BIUV-7]|uniref:DUF4893 domain-containing protein n=1 Tax=Sphingomonas natans TaxID=3063330 RepID=A0ABT8Y522_9SPHN|nr:DUF4893 domain-containing protein [Sphingomonas sp. BIUV-7]MDO6413425.1 DUF4893 domain-containing protein [Sphingomonas sp. BIUV-7]
MRATHLLAFVASLPLVASVAWAAKRPPSPTAWRLVITEADRSRLRNWRDAWVLGLDQARAAGQSAAIADEGALLDPDAGLENPILPDGDYECRTIKIGRKAATGSAFSVYPAATCRVGAGRFIKLDGPQRPSGTLWPFDPTRLIFLGAMALGDEPRALDYGRDHDRDVIGLVERIGPHRWRLVLPQPIWESQTDVIELLPKTNAVTPPGGGG